MWKPTNQPTSPSRPGEPERPAMPASSVPSMSEPAAAAAPRTAATTTTTADQATIGKSLVIKGEVTGSEALYIDGGVEGSINLSGTRVPGGRNGGVAEHKQSRER